VSRRPVSGRSLGRLAADFGRPLPSPDPASQPCPEPDPFQYLVGRHGRARAGAGWAAVPAPLSVYRMTSEQAAGVWPLIAGGGLPCTGAAIGIDFLTGGAFHADPVGWTLAGTAGVANPNLILFGAPGRGKSAMVKMLALRLMPFGYRTLVLGDVKDEYEPLCRALGVTPHAIGHGLPARINPLDPGPLGHGWTTLPAAETRRRATLLFSRWLVLLRGLLGAQHVPFEPTSETVLGQALRELTGHTAGADRLAEPTIPQLWRALDEPNPTLVRGCRFASREDFLSGTRPLRDGLGTLVHGHLAGLFDAATTIVVDWAAPIQSLSLSRLDPLGDEAVGVALTCLNSWGRAMTELAGPDELRVVVRDECWKQMRLGVDAVKSLDADLRLSRRDGCVQVVVAHKPSDMLAVGDAGSQAVTIARDLLHLCATRVLLGQDAQVAAELADLLGLAPMAIRVVSEWTTAAPGRALWLVGQHTAKVQAIRTAVEVALTDTNAALGRTAPSVADPRPMAGDRPDRRPRAVAWS
jgi:hypothetical protein